MDGIQLSAGVEVDGKISRLPVDFLSASAARLWVATRADSSKYDFIPSDHGNASLNH